MMTYQADINFIFSEGKFEIEEFGRSEQKDPQSSKPWIEKRTSGWCKASLLFVISADLNRF